MLSLSAHCSRALAARTRATGPASCDELAGLRAVYAVITCERVEQEKAWQCTTSV